MSTPLTWRCTARSCAIFCPPTLPQLLRSETRGIAGAVSQAGNEETECRRGGAVDGVEATRSSRGGAARRTTAATQLNESSSRSRAVHASSHRALAGPAASGTDASCDLSGSGVEAVLPF